MTKKKKKIKKDKSDISVDTLYDFFLELNEKENIDENETFDFENFVNNLPCELNELLNGPITEDEIVKKY